MASSRRHQLGGYLPIEDYGMIGNMHTCALVGIDGSIDYMCWPVFDSPSVFCRLLDKDKGGFFSVSPRRGLNYTTKQQYLPYSCILRTRYINEHGAVDLVDFFPRPKSARVMIRGPSYNAGNMGTYGEMTNVQEELKKWLVRRVECIRGSLTMDIEIFPSFGYGKEPHTTRLFCEVHRPSRGQSKVATFHSKHANLQLDISLDTEKDDNNNGNGSPVIYFERAEYGGIQGDGLVAHVEIHEGQTISFILRDDRDSHTTPKITTSVLDNQQHDTQMFWFNFISQSKYKGRWREVVSRSLMTLKMLTYEPTGAIIAAPTFSIPEDIGGVRNWDYRFSWVRDSSFTIYILLRMGFKAEAEAYMQFIMDRFLHSRLPDGGMPIMFTIHGSTEVPESTLDHLEGYRGSSPVRIGNGAAFHQQFDIYGELMDAIYLYNKYGTPVSYAVWMAVRELLEPDMSIWEVRNKKQHFTYSKIMLWVAFDRGLRLADKRCFPCPNREKWLKTRDSLYDEIMDKGYNKEMQCFIQSYESNTSLDSSILIAPLVFFISPCDPYFIKTLDRILLPPEKGGLTSTGLVYRYDTNLTDDGVGGKEGAFSMCTFWLVEAMTRAGVHDRKYLVRAMNLFENVLGFSNHLSMFSEEISRSGEQLGNTPQAFSHLAFISAAFNLDRVAGDSAA
ncbi:Glucoamylase (glucan-1,4-alpha-glucosidase), GH15 family [Geosmithia morbida]|uniref:Glucoamylase (Glucan-1,4-alpha-glucosidase), GH15 family n=1 Tax=Geosmithia morbida TaxID=1094350 RepID=A0A9P5D3E4_9HYPO|nr:Glucoamylase (glucan-1,4-alpha-glucosidase), GH15 family [Geosmithia morbida]KAF4122461.1 Glucoamylase (glucan-1,4-alpha-glucosidase), GH15 family [Geosmithia morbida]